MTALRTALMWLVIVVTASSANAGAYEDFFFAIQRDNAVMIQSLLVRGFDPNSVNPQGEPALLMAIEQPALKVVQVLLEQPSLRVEVRNQNDESVLMLAALRGYEAICRQLIARNADINRPGWTPLHYAATGGHRQIVRMLLDQQAAINSASPNGSTPLMMAARYGSLETVQLLLDAGADPMIRNELGLEAIDFALQVQRAEAAAVIARARKAPP